MALPEELHMPSLADLGKNQGTLMLNAMFHRGGPRNDLLRRQFFNLVRLIDLSVSLYEKARANLEASLPSGENRLGSNLSAVDHLELCVITVRRVLDALDAVRNRPQDAIDARFTERALRRFAGILGEVRNMVVHVERDINNGRISAGESHALMVSEDGRTASIGSHQLSLNDLGSALCRLHALGAELAEYRESDAKPSLPTN